MKRFFVFGLAVLMFSGSVFAQEYAEQGVLEFGGSAGYISSKTGYEPAAVGANKETISQLMLAPEVNYFVADYISLGLILDIAKTTYNSGDPGASDMNSVTTTALFAPRFIFQTETENVYPYIGLLVGIYKDSTKTTGYSYSSSDTEFGAEVGVRLQICESGLLKIGFRYLTISGTEKPNTGADIDYNVEDLRLQVGFTLYK